MSKLWIAIFIVALNSKSFASSSIALVYKGPGACEDGADGCAESAARVARAAGFTPVFVAPDGSVIGEDTERSWKNARVWLQPGGRAKAQILAMTPELKSRVREFVRAGGGYVGFCAGGFIATEKFGWHSTDGVGDFEASALGLLPGYSQYYEKYDDELDKDHTAKIVETTWLGKKRDVYWELGPYFDQTTLVEGVDVVSRYPDNTVMTVRSKFGNGRVFVTAVHPEAPLSWRTYFKLQDRDGLDESLAIEMIRWAATR